MAGARAKGYPQRVVRSSHALPLAGAGALALAVAGCGDSLDVSVDYRVVGLAPATGGTCGAVPRTPPIATGATKVRFTFRDHTPTGPGALRCDVVLPRGGEAPVLAVPRKAEPVDLWVEYFTDAGALVARGQASDVALTGGTVTIYTTDADGYACEPAKPTQPRAFHSATLLPTGEVLFLGGLTGPASGASADFTPAAGAYVTASAEIYDSASGRVTPLVIAGLSPRAFHQVVVLGTDANGDVRLAVSGGLGVAGDAAAAGNVAAIGGPMGEAPWGPVAVDAALGRAGAVPVAAELLTYSPSTRAVVRTPIVGASGALGAAAGQADSEFGSPRLIGGGLGAGGDVLDALTPTGEIAVSLPGVPRVGASVVATTATSALWYGGDLGGTRLFDKVIQLDATPALTAGPAAPQAGLNRAFAHGGPPRRRGHRGRRPAHRHRRDQRHHRRGARRARRHRHRRRDRAAGRRLPRRGVHGLGAAAAPRRADQRRRRRRRSGVPGHAGVRRRPERALRGRRHRAHHRRRRAGPLRPPPDADARRHDPGERRLHPRRDRRHDPRGRHARALRAPRRRRRSAGRRRAARAPGAVAEQGGVPIAPCAVVRGGPAPDASVDAGASDALEPDALDVDVVAHRTARGGPRLPPASRPAGTARRASAGSAPPPPAACRPG